LRRAGGDDLLHDGVRYQAKALRQSPANGHQRKFTNSIKREGFDARLALSTRKISASTPSITSKPISPGATWRVIH